MNFPKFWALGKKEGCACWRSSEGSFQEAKRSADQAAASLFERWKHGALRAASSASRSYEYGVGLLREEPLEEIRDSRGEILGVLTRNAYGSLILNTSQVMFVDIDIAETKKTSGTSGGFLSKLFGGGKVPPPGDQDPFLKILQATKDWVRANSRWSFRVYRTRAGVRLLATNGLVDPQSKEAESVFKALGADPLYQGLCRRQKSFRARVSPKPWRCHSTYPPERWPFIDENGESDAKAATKFQSWLADYDKRASKFASCRYIETVGSQEIHPEIAPVVAMHDDLSKSKTDFLLA